MYVRKSQTWRGHPIVSLVRVRVHVAYSQVGDLQCVCAFTHVGNLQCLCYQFTCASCIKCVSPSRVVEYRAPP